ncbi:MAG: AraC family ligand binding domain-containing protein [Vicinamibacterales bacterium]
MKAVVMMCAGLLIAGSALAQNPAAGAARPAAAQAEAAPPAPPPGSAGIFKANSDLQAVLAKAMAGATDMSTSAVANTDQYRVNIVHRPKANFAIAHPGNTELHYIIEGSGTVTTGGKIVRKPGAAASTATIEGGESHKVTKGDIVIVPAGSAHMYSEVAASGITYLEVRFVAPK